MTAGKTSTLVGGGVAAVGMLGMMLGIVLGGSAQINLADLGTVGIGSQLKPGVVPAQYVELVQRAGSQCPEITPPLIAAQIDQESKWDPTAGSGKGAQGIAQFMPGTWRTYGRDENGDGLANVYDPADAIPAQGRMMCELIDTMKGWLKAGKVEGDLVDLALAGYNAGPGGPNSDKGVYVHGGVPPYAETQTYIKRIRKLAAEYAQPAPTVPAGNGAGWVTPAAGRCSSPFGPRWGTFHRGQDIAGPIGTPILAASAGTVIASGPASGYGLWVKIQHPGGVVTIYGHNNRNTVAVGQQVAAGQQVAEIGDRGQSTGPHLHYQVEVNGQPVDPVSWHQQQGAPPLCG
ncbi:peptidoglycan DD-metalloendopeptidase family protein [Saccharopolyspora pogona]|uniref:peptidoglycan DD-metalloendopeptidase family protein n=1 Tax=Saccharopolyspora pogona TaxID=333966 RepID=UPI001CC24060|nr:peptidoglycan DD-metalloendopeptidase family protein [Saccharopolyspora pogona]